MDSLKPCPFCGGEACLRFDPGGKTTGALGHAFVECQKCGVVPYVRLVYSGLPKEGALKGVVEAWNRRAGEQDE